jgi:hypothetical protein
MPKKWVKSRQKKKKWVTSGIRVSGNRLGSLNGIMKEGNVPEDLKKYYSRYKKYTTKLSVKQRN